MRLTIAWVVAGEGLYATAEPQQNGSRCGINFVEFKQYDARQIVCRMGRLYCGVNIVTDPSLGCAKLMKIGTNIGNLPHTALLGKFKFLNKYCGD